MNSAVFLHCRIVPEQTAFVVERFGRYSKTLTPGIHLLIPVVTALKPQTTTNAETKLDFSTQ